MKEIFTVMIDGVGYDYTNFAEALEHLKELHTLGFYEATLRKYSSDYEKPLIYSESSHCFFLQD